MFVRWFFTCFYLHCCCSWHKTMATVFVRSLNIVQGTLKSSFPNYCSMVEKLPPLSKVMRLMQLARLDKLKLKFSSFKVLLYWLVHNYDVLLFSNPLEVKTDVQEALGLTSFTKSKNLLPKTSYVPYCFFDKVWVFCQRCFSVCSICPHVGRRKLLDPSRIWGDLVLGR